MVRVRDALAMGVVLSTARKAAGLTQDELATNVGTYQDQLSRIEAGHATRQLSLLFSLLRELGLQLRVEPLEAS